jgi:hypothetical protein
MNKSQAGKLAVLWRGDRYARSEATAENNCVFEALAGIQKKPAAYAGDMSDEVREQLLNCDGVLVWVDPILRDRIGWCSMRFCATSHREVCG